MHWCGELGTMDREQEVEMSDETRDVIQRFHDALNSHDLDALAPLVHENCVFETTDPPDGTRHVGQAEVLAACRQFFEQSPGAQFEMEEVLTFDDRRWSCGGMPGATVMYVALM